MELVEIPTITLIDCSENRLSGESTGSETMLPIEFVFSLRRQYSFIFLG